MQKTLLAVMLAASASQAVAAGDSVDVSVIGQIVPAACTPALSGSATFDYGTIKAETIAKDDFTVLPVKNLNFTIMCEAAMKVAVYGNDVRASSSIGSPNDLNITVNAAKNQKLNGLGLNGKALIGGYSLYMSDSSINVDGKTVDTIYAAAGSVKPNESGVWNKQSDPTTVFNGNYAKGYNSFYQSWAKAGDITPVAFKTLNGVLSVQAIINKRSELDLTQTITLDGLNTISLYYL